MTEPAHPTEKYIEGRISYLESGIRYFSQVGEVRLEKWSREQLAVWNDKLAVLKGKREMGDGE